MASDEPTPPSHDASPAATGSGAALQTVQISPDAKTALVPPLELRVLAGSAQGRVYRSQGERIAIGSHPRASLVIDDPTVSRFHCEVALEEGRIVIRDLGSLNGTYVDGVHIAQAFLTPGARLRIGSSEIELDFGPEPVAVPLSARTQFGHLVGASRSMRQAFALLESAAASDATVLIVGETGTGKELAAEAVHEASSRRDAPFIIVDCGALPRELMESELFGHEKGAFTGAQNARAGAFEAAHGGTLFLDEIGELELELQPKLLRALERRHVRRVGSNQYRDVNVRVIAATNRSLEREVNAQRFRSDLYYRLAVLEVRLPALRERREDIPTLVEAILDHLGAKQRPEAAALRTPATAATLSRHPWPGNVRELRNYVERSLVMSSLPPLASSTGDFDAAPGGTRVDVDARQPYRDARDVALRDFERAYIEKLLELHGGNVSAAARAAGIDRKYLYRLMWRHSLR
jgi:transcriptional regulator with PAS, ATPase and Fis domain